MEKSSTVKFIKFFDDYFQVFLKYDGWFFHIM